MVETADLTNHFLIAMPQLTDPNFSQTVTYICEHNREGALGIVINRPLDLRLGEILTHMDLESHDAAVTELPVYLGGPVQTDRGFVVHRGAGRWEATMEVTDEISVTSSRDILGAIARGEGPKRMLVALGYAGWASGQLEREIAENAWLSGPADPEILFELAHGARWSAAAARLGVDLALLSGQAGHG